MPYRLRPRGLSKPPGIPSVNPRDPINRFLNGRWLPGVTLYNLYGTGALTTAGSPPTVESALGPALSFNGSSQYIQQKASTQFFNGTLGSISLWFKCTSFGSGFPCIAERDDDASDWGFQLLIAASSSLLDWTVNNTTTAVNVTTTISTAILYHAVGTFDGANAVLYLNGANIGSQALVGSARGAQAAWTFGAKGLIGGSYFNGIIDNIATFHLPLTQADVTRLYTDPYAGLIFPQDRVLLGLNDTNAKPIGSPCGTTMTLMGVGCAIGSAIQRNGIANRRSFLRGQWR